MRWTNQNRFQCLLQVYTICIYLYTLTRKNILPIGLIKICRATVFFINGAHKWLPKKVSLRNCNICNIENENIYLGATTYLVWNLTGWYAACMYTLYVHIIFVLVHNLLNGKLILQSDTDNIVLCAFRFWVVGLGIYGIYICCAVIKEVKTLHSQ